LRTVGPARGQSRNSRIVHACRSQVVKQAGGFTFDFLCLAFGVDQIRPPRTIIARCLALTLATRPARFDKLLRQNVDLLAPLA